MIFVEDTVSQDNTGSGILALSAVTPVQVTIDNSRFDNNAVGVSAQDFSWFSIRNSQAGGNSQVGFLAKANTGTALVSIANSTAGNNATGIQAGGGAAPSNIRLSGVSVFLNVTGMTTAPMAPSRLSAITTTAAVEDQPQASRHSRIPEL